MINISEDKNLAGIKQYYSSDKALEKLLKAVASARNSELGKIAALEYEALLNDHEDYSASVKRSYNRNSIVSSLKPLALLVQINLSNSASPDDFIKSLVS